MLLLISVGITYWLAPVFTFQQKAASTNTSEEFIAFLDQEIPRLMEAYKIPGVVIGMISDGRPVWKNAYGAADVEAGRRMTTDTYCRMESISKSVSAWGVMKLVEEGKIHLDTPVVKYLKTWKFPPSPYDEEQVTTRLLLSQQAGMPLGTIGIRYSPTSEKPSLHELLSKDAVLQEEPGKEFSYSNTGFILLELLIEEVKQRSFSQFMEQEVLLPLGMQKSSFEWDSTFSPPVANGYDSSGDPIPVYVYPDKAAGGLFATLDDVMQFVIAGFPGDPRSSRVLSKESIQSMYTPRVYIAGLYGVAFEYYGFGHFIDQLPEGKRAVSHGGQGTGWMTQFYAVPEDGNGLVIFSNSQRSWPFFAAILNEWGSFEGYGAIGMGKLVIAAKAIWFFFGLLLFLWLWKTWQVFEDLGSQKRHFAPFSPQQAWRRSFCLLIFLGLAGLLLYAITAAYFEPASLFPVAMKWFAYLSLLYLLFLAVIILFPIQRGDDRVLKG
ncbi:serine hydrolase domain-containing protein [Salinimicrobium sp. TH3]|uniref:serine hydrolase domain-containing protein n=1 Tax=Salinimicrobium sp. TH3 TaxID=2997342 RepID=UPI0022754C64|nr:serine hydrolase domain-containing protein [Salinimicrobium sp. TH3]MCY2688566.1 serine hydrolase [Salinimicrobium sp. TH3]